MKKIVITDPTKLFFAADHHFGHANVIRHCNRPYTDVDEMDADLIRRWNEYVPKDGIVIYLGDITMNADPDVVSDYMYRKLNGNFQRFVVGNHDLRYERLGVIGCPMDMLLVEVRDGGVKQSIHCSHYPLMSWYKMHRGSWHVYGHIHNSKFQNPLARAWNVGVDVNDFRPVSYYDLKAIITDRIKTIGDFTEPNIDD